MKRDDFYTDDVDFQLGKQVKDFLPSPEDLIKREDMQRITMQLPKNTVDFFKKHAKNYGGSYQAMIRELLSQYAKNYSHKDR